MPERGRGRKEGWRGERERLNGGQGRHWRREKEMRYLGLDAASGKLPLTLIGSRSHLQRKSTLKRVERECHSPSWKVQHFVQPSQVGVLSLEHELYF